MGATTQKVIVEWLSAVPLFKSSTKKDLRIVARHLEIVEVSNGTEVAVEGTPGDGFFILLSGTATVTRGNKLVAKLSEGDFFGEMALIDPGPRTATVAVTSDAVLGALHARMFNVILHESSQFRSRLLGTLAARLRQLDRQFDN